MRNIGIVRRLDALGRIVIPREYRKMHRIELGDPLEIIAQDNGEIVLRKVDLTVELTSFGQTVADAAARQTGRTVLVGSSKKWLSGAGATKASYVGQEIPAAVAKAITLRKEETGLCSDMGVKEGDGNHITLCPITGDVDCFGVLALIGSAPASEEDLRLLRALASVTGVNLQHY